jgi:hypothetical protein
VTKFECKQNSQTNQLYESEQMDSFQLNMSQEDQVRLVLFGYEKEKYSLKQFQLFERCNAHVQKNGIQNSHRNDLNDKKLFEV